MTEVTDDQQQQRRQEEAFRCKYEGCNVWLDSTAAYEAHYNQYVVHTWRGGGGLRMLLVFSDFLTFTKIVK